MAQFRIKNGLIVDNGGITVTGSISSTAGFTGSFSGIATSASFASTASFVASSQTDALQNSRLTANEARTGSYATTGSNTFIGTQIFTGSLYVTSDLIVQGSSSLQNITASAVSVGTNTVIMNTSTPILRFGGVSVQDSGSTAGRSGSLFWDSLADHWININPSGSDEGYNSAMIINGPKNTGSLGSEAGLTEFYIPVSQGEDHITDSIIFQSGSRNIGIGTTNPGAQLEVTSATGGTLRLKRDDGTVTTDETLGTVEFHTNDGDGPHIASYIRGLGADLSGQNFGRFGALSFGVSKTANTDAVEAMRIDLSGNVGIGTTSPSVALDIVGADNTTSRGRYVKTGEGILQLGANRSTSNIPYIGSENNYGFAFITNDTERMRITSGGNTLIGTSTDAGYRLSVSNNGNNTYLGVTNQTGGTGDRYIRIGFGSGHTYATIQGTRLSVADDINLILQPGGANVGIGITSPVSRLHIENSSGSDILRLSSTSVNTRYVYTITGGATDPFTLRRNHINVGDLDIMTWDYNGRVGIGTTDPGGWKFRVISSADGAQITSGASTQTLNLLNASANPTILRINNNNGNFYDIQNNVSNNSLTFDYNDTTRMTILSNGAIIAGRTLGNGYSQTSTSSTTSIIDTGITYDTGDYGGYGTGTTYQVVYHGNANNAGSGAYFSQYMGILMVYTGWSGSAVTTYIQYTQLASGANVGTLTLTPHFWNGSSQVSSIGVYTGGYQIRLRIDGYNSSFVGANQGVYLTRLSS